jgi:hypothetical protein
MAMAVSNGSRVIGLEGEEEMASIESAKELDGHLQDEPLSKQASQSPASHWRHLQGVLRDTPLRNRHILFQEVSRNDSLVCSVILFFLGERGCRAGEPPGCGVSRPTATCCLRILLRRALRPYPITDDGSSPWSIVVFKALRVSLGNSVDTTKRNQDVASPGPRPLAVFGYFSDEHYAALRRIYRVAKVMTIGGPYPITDDGSSPWSIVVFKALRVSLGNSVDSGVSRKTPWRTRMQSR